MRALTQALQRRRADATLSCVPEKSPRWRSALQPAQTGMLQSAAALLTHLWEALVSAFPSASSNIHHRDGSDAPEALMAHQRPAVVMQHGRR